jgi:iron complex outermembrane receptor protein
MSGLAQAQTTPAATDQKANSSMGELVVTAERRPENLQTTAIAATVISGATLQNKGVLQVDQLQFIAPSVVIDNFGQGIDFNIRGIGKAEHNSQTTTGVITYRDGVPTFPGYFTEEPYYDIASVEILRGPQGTFSGENATGGAVLVNTNNPVIGGGYHGYVQAQVGNYTDLGAQGAVNIPISDTFAARIALFTDRRDSFYSFTGPGGGPYTGNPGNVRWGAGRISLLWTPEEKLSVLVKADFDYLDNGAYPADPFYDANDEYHLTANSPQLALDKFARVSMKIDYTLPHDIDLRSISAYQRGNTAYQADLDGTAVGNNFFADSVDEETYSQELDIISPNKGLITWVVGGFAQWDNLNFLPPYQFIIATPLTSPPTPAADYVLQGKNPKTDFAGFGQINLNLPGGLQAQFGARYSSFKTTNKNVEIIQYGLPLDDEQSASYNDFSYKAALNWTINQDNFVYAFIATGYRPGGLNVPVGLGIPAPFGAEKVTEYEAGWKSTMLDGHIRTQIDGFYDSYDNFQVTIGYPAFPTFGFELNNPNTTKIYGFEAETQAVFGDLSLSAGVAVMHSSLGTFFATDPRIASFTACNPATGPASASCINLSGHPQTYAPNFTFNVSGQYIFHLNDGTTLTPRANFGHVSPQWATLFDNPALGDRLVARDILGAELALSHGGWTGTLYGTNLTDQHYVAALNSGLRFAGFPRQFGFRLMKLF